MTEEEKQLIVCRLHGHKTSWMHGEGIKSYQYCFTCAFNEQKWLTSIHRKNFYKRKQKENI